MQYQTAEAAYQAIQQLNTYTAVGIETRPLSKLDEDFLSAFSVILLNDCDEVVYAHLSVQLMDYSNNQFES